jgi:hypothetical protein
MTNVILNGITVDIQDIKMLHEKYLLSMIYEHDWQKVIYQFL